MSFPLWDLAPAYSGMTEPMLVIRALSPDGVEQLRWTQNHLGDHQLSGYLGGPRPTKVGPIGFSEAERVERRLLDRTVCDLELGVYKVLPVQWVVADTRVSGDPDTSGWGSTYLDRVLSYARGGLGINLLEVSLCGNGGPFRRCKLVEYSAKSADGTATRLVIDAVFKQCSLSRALPGVGTTQPYGPMTKLGW